MTTVTQETLDIGLTKAHTYLMSSTEFRTVTLTPAEAALRDAQMGWNEALRFGMPGTVARARRFLAEARAAVDAERGPLPIRSSAS